MKVVEVVPSTTTIQNTVHVAVLAFPFGSHARSILGLVQKIASSSSPNIMFSFFSTEESIASVMADLNTDKLRARLRLYRVDDGLPEAFVPSSGNPMERLNLFLKWMPENYRRAMEETGKRFTCLITDAFLWFSADVAEELGAMWVPLWTAGPHSLLSHVSTDILRTKIGCNNGGEKDDEKLDFLGGFSEVKVSDLPEEILSENIEEPFTRMLYKMSHTLPRATAVVINSFDALVPTIVHELHFHFKLFLNVGPFPLTTTMPQLTLPPPSLVSDDHDCIDYWLRRQKHESVIYISFGSVITPPPNELSAIAEALEECSFPFIWSFRGDPEKQLPLGFLERTRTKGKVVTWAPQTVILKHKAVGVFVTHGGWNSVLESIIGGVPMICRPFFGDQRLNTRMLETVWGIGVGVENWVFTKEGMVKAINTVLESEKGTVMRKKMNEFQGAAMEAANEAWGSSTMNIQILTKLVTGGSSAVVL